jgi:peroxiredoxin
MTEETMRTGLVLALLLAMGCKGGDTSAPAAEAPVAAKEAKATAAGGSASAAAELEVGATAPDFTLSDLDGKPVSLKDHRGKLVVLEWYNPDCPFVKAAHTDGPLVDLAKRYADKGVVWLAINSGAPGKQGHGAERNRASVQEYGIAHPVLLDEDGKVGRAYGATATPHMYVVDKEGKLVYRGALDNRPLGKLKGDTFTAYTQDAIEAALDGRPAPTAVTQSWGCSVKYAD